jgi:hypothetical protein
VGEEAATWRFSCGLNNGDPVSVQFVLCVSVEMV